MSTKVAFVTGAATGIGFYVVKGLCERFDGVVYLTGRHTDKGMAAIKQLSELGCQAKFHELDVTKKESIEEFSKYIKETYGGVDLIVNNASVFFLYSPVPKYDESITVLDVDYNGIKNIGEYFYPILRQNGRVVNVSSTDGHLSGIPNELVRKELSDKNITLEKLESLVQTELKKIKDNKLDEAERAVGYYNYRLAKAAAYILSVLHSKELASRNIAVNAPHPGFCLTYDILVGLATSTAEEGSSPILYAALDAPQEMTGKFIWCNNDVVDWYDTSIPASDMLHLTKHDPSPYQNQKVPKDNPKWINLEKMAKLLIK